ncbi:Copper resistance protein C precursor CopC [Herminiimonas arsenicoxydans]|uniref:Copper resistance protein C CopC n=1 Tax=Herminiimonas arsenicoxydans TaxID=204773 RepID=A4G2L4_HERAR|nr:Copper resistance protein C precursor CopC [Herminiimonas arsenicoxydans]
MSFSSIATKLLMASAATLFATSVFAHPDLVSSTPADKSEGPAPAKIELTFSETLNTQFSGANLIMTDMPNMPGHGAMKMKASVASGVDGKTMVVTPAAPLVGGTYRVDWRAVSSDTHPIKGSISFQVK